MMHKGRIYGEATDALEFAARRGDTFASAEEALAHYLTQFDWVDCSAWKLGTLLFLSDGGGEYGVLRPVAGESGVYEQIESITFSWCDEAKALKLITELQAGTLGTPYTKLTPRFHAKGETCRGCA